LSLLSEICRAANAGRITGGAGIYERPELADCQTTLASCHDPAPNFKSYFAPFFIFWAIKNESSSVCS
jgi:hypothetical protein